MSNLSGRLTRLPPEVRRLVWRFTIEGKEVEDENKEDALGNHLGRYLRRQLDNPAVSFLIRHHLSIADQYVRKLMACRHLLLASEFSNEYWEELLLTQEIMFEARPSGVSWQNALPATLASLERWTKVLKYRNETKLHGLIGIRVDEFDPRDDPEYENYIAPILKGLYNIASEYPPGRVKLWIEYTGICEEVNGIVLFFDIGDCQGTRKKLKPFLKGVDRDFKLSVAEDDTYGLLDIVDEEDEGDLEFQKKRRDKEWKHWMLDLKVHSEVVLGMMNDLEKESKT